MSQWTLAQVSRLLREPQHKLIYLCEKGAVVPDLGDAKGRGSSRLFSDRNVLEFALTLRLRKLELPVGVVAAILHVLRRFAEGLRKNDSGFDLVESLRGPKSVDLRILVKDGEELFFSLAGPSSPVRLFGGLDFRELSRRQPPPTPRKFKEIRQRPSGRPSLGAPEYSREARIEISVTEVARGLRLDA